MKYARRLQPRERTFTDGSKTKTSPYSLYLAIVSVLCESSFCFYSKYPKRTIVSLMSFSVSGVEQVDIETVSVIFIVYMSSMMCSTCVHIISIFFLHRCAHVAENVGMLWHNLHKGTQRTTENKCQGILIHFICRFFSSSLFLHFFFCAVLLPVKWNPSL